MKEHPLYRIWVGMKTRCYNVKSKDYPLYGGRGIKVCDRWVNSFQSFADDMGERPSSNHSIDRFPDNDGNYEPSNCRWATPAEQSKNKRPNVSQIKLTKEQKVEIYKRLKSGETNGALTREYNVSKSLITRISKNDPES